MELDTTTKGIVLHENDNLLCIKETLSNMKGLRTSISLGQKTNFHLGVSHRKHNGPSLSILL
jgi:hypothetical protein